jgi:hypothetical protein
MTQTSQKNFHNFVYENKLTFATTKPTGNLEQKYSFAPSGWKNLNFEECFSKYSGKGNPLLTDYYWVSLTNSKFIIPFALAKLDIGNLR